MFPTGKLTHRSDVSIAFGMLAADKQMRCPGATEYAARAWVSGRASVSRVRPRPRQFFHSLQTGTWREIDQLRKLDFGHSAILLQRVENLDVDPIKFHGLAPADEDGANVVDIGQSWAGDHEIPNRLKGRVAIVAREHLLRIDAAVAHARECVRRDESADPPPETSAITRSSGPRP
jgi:hypothetical protein